jgi:asparagine synthase (glutamine-hydrolysing)
MCGIVGAVDWTGRSVDEPLLRRMTGQLRHRGPDAEGFVAFQPGRGAAPVAAALGSQRLSIIDLAGGRQPVSNEDGSVWAVLNGEVYNFAELRRQLEAQGHRFASKSDTEVLVHLYEERGDAFVHALDGMFALAVWDDRQQRLVLARDRVGKKPLVYAELDGRLVFASELQALMMDPEIPRAVDAAALDAYLTFMAIPAPRTIYRAARKLPPAHMLVADRQGVRAVRYWTLDYGPKVRISEADASSQLAELVTDAVRRRLIGEVPIGAFLSGGIDSSIIVAVMSQLADAPVKTFSIGFAHAPRFNELPHAARVARRFGCEHHEFIVGPRAAEVLPTLVRHFGEPFADSSAIPTYLLAQMARDHVTVALTGDGGDELFAGYGRHLANRLAESWQRLPHPVRRLVERAAGRGGAHGRSKAARFVEAANLPRPDRYRRWAGVLSGDLKQQVLGEAAYAADDGSLDQLFADVEPLDAVDALLAVDTAFYLPTDLLVKMDIATMANSLEARSPLLDRTVMEFAARLPSRFKTRGGRLKHLLRRAFSEELPPEIARRGKQGFAVPLAQWLRTDLRAFISDHLIGSHAARSGLLSQAGIDRLLEGHLKGRADHAHALWTLLMLELWHRTFMESPRAEPVHAA